MIMMMAASTAAAASSTTIGGVGGAAATTTTTLEPSSPPTLPLISKDKNEENNDNGNDTDVTEEEGDIKGIEDVDSKKIDANEGENIENLTLSSSLISNNPIMPTRGRRGRRRKHASGHNPAQIHNSNSNNANIDANDDDDDQRPELKVQDNDETEDGALVDDERKERVEEEVEDEDERKDVQMQDDDEDESKTVKGPTTRAKTCAAAAATAAAVSDRQTDQIEEQQLLATKEKEISALVDEITKLQTTFISLKDRAAAQIAHLEDLIAEKGAILERMERQQQFDDEIRAQINQLKAVAHLTDQSDHRATSGHSNGPNLFSTSSASSFTNKPAPPTSESLSHLFEFYKKLQMDNEAIKVSLESSRLPSSLNSIQSMANSFGGHLNHHLNHHQALFPMTELERAANGGSLQSKGCSDVEDEDEDDDTMKSSRDSPTCQTTPSSHAKSPSLLEGEPEAAAPIIDKLQQILRSNIEKYQNENLNTLNISRCVREFLSTHNIGQRLFAKYILGLSQGTVSELLSKPKSWDKLTEKGRDSYRKMHAWAADERAIMLLKALVPARGKNGKTFMKIEEEQGFLTDAQRSMMITPRSGAPTGYPSMPPRFSFGFEAAPPQLLNGGSYSHSQQPSSAAFLNHLSQQSSDLSSRPPPGGLPPHLSSSGAPPNFPLDPAMLLKKMPPQGPEGSHSQNPSSSASAAAAAESSELVARLYQEELTRLLTAQGANLFNLQMGLKPESSPDDRSATAAALSGNKFQDDIRTALMIYHQELARLAQLQREGQSPSAIESQTAAFQQLAGLFNGAQGQLAAGNLTPGGLNDDRDSSTAKSSPSPKSSSSPKFDDPKAASGGAAEDLSQSASNPLQRMASITNSLLSQAASAPSPAACITSRTTKAILPPITQQQFDHYNNLNTEDIVKKVKEQLSQYSISQRLFGESVLGLSQGSVSDLLARPKPWHMLTQKGREPFIRMQMFIEDENAIHKLVASQYKISPEKLMRTGGGFTPGGTTPMPTNPSHLMGSHQISSPPAGRMIRPNISESPVTNFRSPSIAAATASMSPRLSEGSAMRNQPGPPAIRSESSTPDDTGKFMPSTPLSAALSASNPNSKDSIMSSHLSTLTKLNQIATSNQLAASRNASYMQPSVYELAALTTDLDTQAVTNAIKETLLTHNIGQKIFGEVVLGLSQGSVSELLSKPKPWHMLSIKGREPFIRMHLWLQDKSNIEKLQKIKDERREQSKRRRQEDGGFSASGDHQRSSLGMSLGGAGFPGMDRSMSRYTDTPTDGMGDDSPVAKKPRVLFTDEQKEALKLAYKMDPYPSTATIEFLAGELNLSVRTITNWFHNHRMRQKQYQSMPNNNNNCSNNSGSADEMTNSSTGSMHRGGGGLDPSLGPYPTSFDPLRFKLQLAQQLAEQQQKQALYSQSLSSHPPSALMDLPLPQFGAHSLQSSLNNRRYSGSSDSNDSGAGASDDPDTLDLSVGSRKRSIRSPPNSQSMRSGSASPSSSRASDEMSDGAPLGGSSTLSSSHQALTNNNQTSSGSSRRKAAPVKYVAAVAPVYDDDEEDEESAARRQDGSDDEMMPANLVVSGKNNGKSNERSCNKIGASSPTR